VLCVWAQARAIRRETALAWTAYIVSAALLSRRAFERVGPFSTDHSVGEFLDWHLRAREAGLRELMLPDVVARRRVHRDNNSFRLRDRRGEYVEILKASLDRRRAR
jgi:GT2 family glycosyltransferase